MTLRGQLALVIGLMTFLPNLAVAVGFWFSSRGQLAGALGLILLWVLLLAGLSAVAGYALAHALLRPLDELTRTLGYLVGSERALSELSLPRPKEAPPSEIKALRTSFDALLDHVRELSETRQAVFSTLAHDLKTPLLASLRASEYLEEADQIGADRRKELLKELGTEISRSYGLVENLLTTSKLDAQRPQPETLNLRAVLEDLKLRFEREAKRRGVALEASGAGQARADRQFLERALANLTENALRHARSRIVLRAGEGLVEVEDDGPGLPDALENLWQPFRSTRLRGVRAGSAGLGLYIVRRVAEIHGGRLESRQGELGGACLRLKLN